MSTGGFISAAIQVCEITDARQRTRSADKSGFFSPTSGLEKPSPTSRRNCTANSSTRRYARETSQDYVDARRTSIVHVCRRDWAFRGEHRRHPLSLATPVRCYSPYYGPVHRGLDAAGFHRPEVVNLQQWTSRSRVVNHPARIADRLRLAAVATAAAASADCSSD